MSIAKAGIVKMGTSTLESALMNMPMISYYSTSWISYQISRSKITLPWIALPNILLGKTLIPEFIQKDANPDQMLNGILSLLSEQDLQNQIKGFNEIRSILGGPGASERAAHMIADILGLRK
jgi:lipid-A-disaccharide synthase